MKSPSVLTVGAFLAAWAGSNFSPDYRSVLMAVLAGVFGYATPKKK
jgi:Ca2+/Na+ antiporter